MTIIKLAKKRGHYNHYSAKYKGTIANHAIQHGTSAAIKYFKPQYPSLKWSTMNDWRKSLIANTTQNQQTGQIEPIKQLEEKKRGRPSILSDELTKSLRSYIQSIRDAGGVVSTALIIAAGTGILQHKEPLSSACNGGHIIMKKSWVKYFLGKMNL